MINLYVKFNVHSSYVKQVIVLKSGGQTDGRTRLVTTIGIRQNFGWGLKNLQKFYSMDMLTYYWHVKKPK